MLTSDKNQLITGQFNAQIDCMTEVKGPQGTENVMDIDERLLNFYAANQLKVCGSLF